MGTRTAFVHCAFLHAWNSAWPWEELRKHTSNEWLSRNSPLMDGILQADFFFFFLVKGPLVKVFAEPSLEL